MGGGKSVAIGATVAENDKDEVRPKTRASNKRSCASFPADACEVSVDVVAGSVCIAARPQLRCSVMPRTGELGGALGPPNRFIRQATERRLDGKTVVIRCADRVRLDAVWATSRKAHQPICAAIIFHGNGQTLDDMVEWAAWHSKEGRHALLVTMRGYPGSEGDPNVSGEEGLYCDASAAAQFVLEKGVPQHLVVAHGFSLGGALACACACHHGLGALVLDHSFTSPAAVARHVVAGTWLPSWLAAGTMAGAWPKGCPVSIRPSQGAAIQTDGLDACAKLRDYRGGLAVIYGDADEIMPATFAEELAAARYGSDAEALRCAVPIVNGTHNRRMFFQVHEVSASLGDMLRRYLSFV